MIKGQKNKRIVTKLMKWLYIIIALLIVLFLSLYFHDAYYNHGKILPWFNRSQSDCTNHQQSSTLPNIKHPDDLHYKSELNNNISCAELQKSSNSTNSSEDLLQSNYTTTMLQVHRVVVKFLQDIDYSHEISILMQQSFTNEVNAILAQLASYSNNYLNSELTTIQQPTKHNNRFNHIVNYFLKIEKILYNPKQKELDRHNIINNLYILNEYFYTPQFLKTFIK